MDLKTFENELYKLWEKVGKKNQSFTIIIVDISDEGIIEQGYIISTTCPVCHSKVLADMIEDGAIPHTSDLEKNNTDDVKAVH